MRIPLPLRILVADDNELLRIGIRTLLEIKRDWVVCGEASDGEEAISKALALAPDVVILDLSMPMLNGFRAAEQIRFDSPSTKIVFLSVHDVPATASAAGADAFVSKASPADELISTIERVTRKSTAVGGN